MSQASPAISEKRFGKAREPFASLLAIKLDRRREKRVRTDIKGKLAFGEDWAFTIDCTICDMSSGGAQVKVEGGVQIPDSVCLIHPAALTAYESVVRWKKADGAFGLMFRATHDLSLPTTYPLKVLRQICMDGAEGALPVPSNSNSPAAPRPVSAKAMAKAITQYKSAMAAALAGKKAARTAIAVGEAQLAADQTALRDAIMSDASQSRIAAAHDAVRKAHAQLAVDQAALASADEHIRAAQKILAQAANKALTAGAFAKINKVLGLA